MPSADLGTERHSAADSVTAVSFLSRSAARSPFQVWVCEGRVTGTGYNRPSPILGIPCMWPSQESGRGCTGVGTARLTEHSMQQWAGVRVWTDWESLQRSPQLGPPIPLPAHAPAA